MNLVEAAMKHRQVTLILTFIFVLAGVYSLTHMARREDPQLTIRQGLIIMPYPGAKTIQVDEQVTKKIEQYLFRYNEIKKKDTFSTTSDGLCVITVELQGWVKNKDKFWSKVRHGLYELKNTQLPEGVLGPIINSDFGDTIALLIAIESDRHSYVELKNYLEIIEDELRPLPEVSKLKRYGEQKEQIYVTTNSQKLSQFSIGLPQVIGAMKSQNTIRYSGEIKSKNSEVPIHTKDQYTSEEQILNQQVYVSPRGEVVRVKDIANVERRYEEPDSFIRVDDHKVIMLSVEMQDGYNIVDFGKKVNEKLKLAVKRIPSDVGVKKIIDQPFVVEASIHHFLKEFMIAIAAVIIVTMLLLPLRMAAVAALAIPITVLITFAFLDALNIELQQMTLSGLIVVLGMVVDNAIVIVDDYVEKLDHDMHPWDAGKKSGTELFIPILTATIAIICAFVPVDLILSGNAGEFLFTLPIAVTVALVVSLFVAILITPLLCYVFIKTGLHTKTKKRVSFLDILQKVYDFVLDKAFKTPKLTVFIGILAVVGTVFLMGLLEIRMFPLIERNQFCLEVYMRQGTNLETTDRAVQKIEKFLKDEKRITNISSFIGCSSPRFYLTYAPKAPDKNYAQLLINTVSNTATQELIDELLVEFDGFILDGDILIKQLQQGPPVDAPVEVRIMGNNLNEIKKIGEQVKQILKNTEGTNFVRTDYREDYYGISVQVDEEVANRMGFSSKDIAQMLAVSFKGFPISTLWEGDNPIEILFRHEEKYRKDFDDIANIYITSSATGARVPLRQIATIVPEWQTGKIIRRNGVRTITVRCEAQMGKMPNDILNQIRPQIKDLEAKLPDGIFISFGGEFEDQVDVMGECTTSLLVSLVCIFLVLLFHFKKVKKVLIVLFTIPLSWFGGILGLYLTNNPFSVTGFLGIISLSGLVVRNGIILMDYADHLLANTKDTKPDIFKIAMAAGKRRMRPVFLTSVAAAAGVVPMIIGGSPLWAPMGSVLAVGLIFGMVLTLIIVPVMYYLAMKSEKKRVKKKEMHTLQESISVCAVFIFLSLSTIGYCNEMPGTIISLPQAIKIAIANNPSIKEAEYKNLSAAEKIKTAKAEMFTTASANFAYTKLKNDPVMKIALPVGPGTPLKMEVQIGHSSIFHWDVTLVQPIFTGFALSTRHDMSKLDLEIKEEEKKQIVLDLIQKVKEAYFNILFVKKIFLISEDAVKSLELHEKDAQKLFDHGMIKYNDLLRAKVALADVRQNYEKTGADVKMAVSYFNTLLDFEIGKNTDVEDISKITMSDSKFLPLVNTAMEHRPVFKILRLGLKTLEKLMVLEKSAYYPGIALVGSYAREGDDFTASYNDFTNDSNAAITLQATWVFCDFGKTKSKILRVRKDHKALLEKIKGIENDIKLEIKDAFLNLGVAKKNIETAKQSLAQANENWRISNLQYRQQIATSSEVLDARTFLTEADTNYYNALYGYMIFLSKLERSVGHPVVLVRDGG
jgi:multidrug efflux pump subunit AcrB/outer membrane protein TolC